MADQDTPIANFVNPETLHTPAGYSHVVEVGRLAREEFLIEIEAVAFIPDH